MFEIPYDIIVTLILIKILWDMMIKKLLFTTIMISLDFMTWLGADPPDPQSGEKDDTLEGLKVRTSLPPHMFAFN